MRAVTSCGSWGLKRELLEAVVSVVGTEGERVTPPSFSVRAATSCGSWGGLSEAIVLVDDTEDEMGERLLGLLRARDEYLELGEDSEVDKLQLIPRGGIEECRGLNRADAL